MDFSKEHVGILDSTTRAHLLLCSQNGVLLLNKRDVFTIFKFSQVSVENQTVFSVGIPLDGWLCLRHVVTVDCTSFGLVLPSCHGLTMETQEQHSATVHLIQM